MGHRNVPCNGPPMWSMGPGIGTSAPMNLGIPWAGWQFASSHKTISSSKMLPQNGYLKCLVDSTTHSNHSEWQMKTPTQRFSGYLCLFSEFHLSSSCADIFCNFSMLFPSNQQVLMSLFRSSSLGAGIFCSLSMLSPSKNEKLSLPAMVSPRHRTLGENLFSKDSSLYAVSLNCPSSQGSSVN
jgi:hypothetical protein